MTDSVCPSSGATCMEPNVCAIYFLISREMSFSVSRSTSFVHINLTLGDDVDRMECAVEPDGKQLALEWLRDDGADRDELDDFAPATHDGVTSSMELPTTCTMADDCMDSGTMDTMALQLSTILIWLRSSDRPFSLLQMHTTPLRKCKGFSTTEMENMRIR